MKSQIFKIFLLVALFFVGKNIVFAADVNLTIRNEANIIYSGIVPLQTPGTIQIQGHDVNANSVLSVLTDADTLSDNFSISDLQYSSMGFYLKCIDSSCDDWQYTVNDSYPWDAIDQKILSGGENLYFYFGPHHKIILSSNSINTDDTLTVSAQDYDYQNNSWLALTGVNIGVTQPDPNNPWSPTEIQVQPVNTDGQATFYLIPAGSYNIGIKEDYYFPTDTLTVTTPPAPEPEPEPVVTPEPARHSGGGYIRQNQNIIIDTPIKPTFDLQKAFNFLIAQQKENGSFGEDLYTDWTALALAETSYPEQISKLTKYLGENKMESPSLTDYERHAMALMSLGLNPHNFNEENYIEKIVSSFDGTQFGDVHEDNDDIFALIVLQNAGYTINDKMINDDIAFVLKAQNTDGSWDNSVDMTGAALQGIINIADESCFLFGSLSVSADTALPLGSSACETPKNKELSLTINKAREFLKQNQKEDGGWGNVSSTAWAIEGILALNEKIEDWTKNGNTPLDYLATMQDEDGGMKNDNINNKIWGTAYVVSALSGKTWNQIMQKFEKPEIPVVLEQSLKNSPITVLPKPKLINKTNTATTATVINATSPLSAPAQTEQKEIPRKNWFVKLIENILSIF